MKRKKEYKMKYQVNTSIAACLETCPSAERRPMVYS